MCAFDQMRCAFGQLRKPNPNHNLTLTLNLIQYPNPDPRLLVLTLTLLQVHSAIDKILRNSSNATGSFDSDQTVKRAIDQMRARTRAIPSETIHSRKIKFLSKLQLSNNILFKTFAKSRPIYEELVSLSSIYAAIY